jgi:hypothetical protein
MADTIDIRKSEELAEAHIYKTIENTAGFQEVAA